MHTYFGIPDIAMEVAYSLDYLHMNPDDQIAIYNVAFLQYSAYLQWSKSALCHRYYFELPDRIQDIISTREEGKPSTFQTLYSIAISIDNHFWEQKCKSERAPHSTPQHSSYLKCSKSRPNLSLSDSNADMEALESSDGFSTWWHTLSPDIPDSDSGLSLAIFDSGSIVSQLATSALFFASQQILSLELSDSDSVLSFLTSGSVPEVQNLQSNSSL